MAMVAAVLLTPAAAFSQSAPDMLEKTLAGVVTVAVKRPAALPKPRGADEPSAELAYQQVLDLSGSASSGSGFVIERNGKKFIVTNYHVVDQVGPDDDALVVYSINRAEYRVRVVGGDVYYDLAVLEFLDKPGPEFRIMTFRNGSVRLGESVYAIGNPLGAFPYTVTQGIVSGKNRVLQGANQSFGYLQTTAAILPGNSGGPLVDEKGRVIGVNTRGSIQTRLFFAIETSRVLQVVDDLLSNGGRVKRAYLGVQVVQAYERVCDQKTDQCVAGRPTGAPTLVTVVPGSPAAQALGGASGAVIQKVRGERVATIDEVRGALERVRPGEPVKIELARGDRVEEVAVPTRELTPEALAGIGAGLIERAGRARVTGHVGGTEGVFVEFAQPFKVEEVVCPGPGGMAKGEPRTVGRLKLIAVGPIALNSEERVWRVDNLEDLGAALRLQSIDGVLTLVGQVDGCFAPLPLMFSDDDATLGRTLFQ